MPMKTSAAMARVPCRPSQASAAAGSGNEFCGFAGIVSFGWRLDREERGLQWMKETMEGPALTHGSTYHVPLHETDRHHRRRSEITRLIMTY
jgi:hypothetical protein